MDNGYGLSCSIAVFLGISQRGDIIILQEQLCRMS